MSKRTKLATVLIVACLLVLLGVLTVYSTPSYPNLNKFDEVDIFLTGEGINSSNYFNASMAEGWGWNFYPIVSSHSQFIINDDFVLLGNQYNPFEIPCLTTESTPTHFWVLSSCVPSYNGSANSKIDYSVLRKAFFGFDIPHRNVSESLNYMEVFQR